MPEPEPIRPLRPPDPPRDRDQRRQALDPARSFLVQAPAGSGKTTLLTQRFLRLLGHAARPDEIVAITFTNAAAAEMRNRVLEALETAERSQTAVPDDQSLDRAVQSGDNAAILGALAARALARDRLLGWQLLDQPSQLRITTIDAFCRSLTLKSPLSWGLLSSLGGRLDPAEPADALYRQAAARTLAVLHEPDSETRRAVESVLLWRDNNWQEVETLIVEMLKSRNRWFQEFVFARDGDWLALRDQLEAPFRRAALSHLESLGQILDRLDGCRDFALRLARKACETPGKFSPFSLAERAELPQTFPDPGAPGAALLLEDAVAAYRDLAGFLLTAKDEWRKQTGLNAHYGYPAGPQGKPAKDRFGDFVDSLAMEPGLQAALAVFQGPMPVGYSGPEWELIRQCFALLRHAAAQLQVVFAETGSVDFTEVAQIALRILAADDGSPSDFAIREADGIRHLLVDEFQDTSRGQHQLLARLVAAWPEREGRSCFCVGDPMQSIYGFREAEVELFERLKTHGLEIADASGPAPLHFEFLSLSANFRTAPSLVADLNRHFEQIFSEDDGSGVRFSPSQAARESRSAAKTELHLAFTQKTKPETSGFPFGDPASTRTAQLDEIVDLIRDRLDAANALRLSGASEKFRIAVLGRTKAAAIRVAEALREAGIGFRAIELVKLRERPEVLDLLSLARALLNPLDRTAWLAVLRAPWCGLSLAELHAIASADDTAIAAAPVPELLEARLEALREGGELAPRACEAASRVGLVLRAARDQRASASALALGTWLESVWAALGGLDTVTPEQHQNLRLLWAALDKLPNAELDLLGPGLDSALDALYALPDPGASSDFGVQLMTIHKAKGLEFEVVVVPDLESASRNSEPAMISWLERGLAMPGPGGQLTEFLIAPISTKGGEAGGARRWVERVKRQRELQELRRLLYVAATRAREELHLFARPQFAVSSSSGDSGLSTPAGLLATAWPALGDEIEARFQAWLESLASAKASPGAAPLAVATLAAQASPANVLHFPEAPQPEARPVFLRRLPEGYRAAEVSWLGQSSAASGALPGEAPQAESGAPYLRAEGGLEARLMGSAIHALLEELSRLRRALNPAEAAQAVAASLPSITAEIRGHGLRRVTAARMAAEALAVAQRASLDPTGAWILAPHAHSEAESRWTGRVSPRSGRVREWILRPDRVFFAPAPEGGEPSWWVVDYKISHSDANIPAHSAEKRAFAEAHRERYASQLGAYAHVLRSLLAEEHGHSPRIRAGIFYPRLQILDFWDA